jgi:hypothetical protein
MLEKEYEYLKTLPDEEVIALFWELYEQAILRLKIKRFVNNKQSYVIRSRDDIRMYETGNPYAIMDIGILHYNSLLAGKEQIVTATIRKHKLSKL